jgi:hypothetical protein
MMFHAMNACTHDYSAGGKDGSVTFAGPYFDAPDRSRSVTVRLTDLDKYTRGALIQDAFPYLSVDDREFLLSGMSPEGFAKLTEDAEE